MTAYPQRVRDSILPLSVGKTLPEAFEEWSFTERTIDHEEPIETCELCEQEALRYHFEIKNHLTKKMMAGSKCILKFGLSVFEEGRKLNPADAKKKLDRLMQQMRLESCVRALERLAATENNAILTNALAYYRKNKYLTPKYAFVVLWRLQKHGIDHSPTFFKINLQKDKYQRDLREMPKSQIPFIWLALNSAQRKKAVELGHTKPDI